MLKRCLILFPILLILTSALMMTASARSDETGFLDRTVRSGGKTPVWAFHGDADTAVPVAESRNLVAAVKAVGGNVRYTEYAGVGHNSWDRAYADRELIAWLLKAGVGD